MISSAFQIMHGYTNSCKPTPRRRLLNIEDSYGPRSRSKEEQVKGGTNRCLWWPGGKYRTTYIFVYNMLHAYENL